MSDGLRGSIEEGETLVGNSHPDFISCIDRLEQLVERETRTLEANGPIDFEEFNVRKTRALFEFLMASRSVPAQASTAIRTRLASLQAKLAENSAMLAQHLDAMREIAGIMIRTMEMAESDGTYSGRSAYRR